MLKRIASAVKRIISGLIVPIAAVGSSNRHVQALFPAFLNLLFVMFLKGGKKWADFFDIHKETRLSVNNDTTHFIIVKKGNEKIFLKE